MRKVIDLESRRKKKNKRAEFNIRQLEEVERILVSFPKAALLRVMSACRKRLREMDDLEKKD